MAQVITFTDCRQNRRPNICIITCTVSNVNRRGNNYSTLAYVNTEVMYLCSFLCVSCNCSWSCTSSYASLLLQGHLTLQHSTTLPKLTSSYGEVSNYLRLLEMRRSSTYLSSHCSSGTKTVT